MSEQMHTARQAIVMAAGIGRRMQPLTLKTPKPLVRVNGVRMIDSVVNGLKQNGITEICVVVGYLKEQFYDWAAGRKDVALTLIENPWYAECNNISSLYVARDWLGDCLILDGDQMIYHPEILCPGFALSGYNAVWCEGETEEWLMKAENGVVKSCSRNGGSRGWQLYSVSRWTEEDGRRLRQQVTEEFEAGNRQIYWDDVAMFLHFEDYRLGIWEMREGDVVEIDSLEELAALDPTYQSYITGAAGKAENIGGNEL